MLKGATENGIMEAVWENHSAPFLCSELKTFVGSYFPDGLLIEKVDSRLKSRILDDCLSVNKAVYYLFHFFLFLFSSFSHFIFTIYSVYELILNLESTSCYVIFCYSFLYKHLLFSLFHCTNLFLVTPH